MVDLAVVVCEPAPARALTVAPLLKQLADDGIPHMLFINKIDTLEGSVGDTLAALQGFAKSPLVLRQVPIVDGETVTGYVDVVSERAYRYRKGQASELIQMPSAMQDDEAGGAEQAGRGAGGSRRHAAREGARGCEADDGGDLQRPAQGPGGGRGDRGAAGFRGEHGRRAAAVEGAAPRYADGSRDRGAQG